MAHSTCKHSRSLFQKSIQRCAEKLGFSLDIKRDDMTGMELSGNKIRKLQVLLADAVRRGADTVITAGGIQSNHCRATAVACSKVGLKCILLHRVADSIAASRDPGYDGNLLLSRAAGAQLRLIDSKQLATADSSGDDLHADVVMRCMAQQYAQSGRSVYVIPVGGSNSLGAFGYIDAAVELLQQCGFQDSSQQATEFPYSDIAVATGSGGTLAGLALGLRLAGCPARVHGFAVCDSPQYFYDYADRHILPNMMAGGCPAPAARDLFVVHDCKGLGYAQSCDAEMHTMRESMAACQVMLDPVYTNKAVHGLLQQMAQHRAAAEGEPGVFQGTKVLFVHTGGLFGLFGQGVSAQGSIGDNGGKLFQTLPAADSSDTQDKCTGASGGGAAAAAGVGGVDAVQLPVLNLRLSEGPATPAELPQATSILDAPIATVQLSHAE